MLHRWLAKIDYGGNEVKRRIFWGFWIYYRSTNTPKGYLQQLLFFGKDCKRRLQKSVTLKPKTSIQPLATYGV